MSQGTKKLGYLRRTLRVDSEVLHFQHMKHYSGLSSITLQSFGIPISNQILTKLESFETKAVLFMFGRYDIKVSPYHITPESPF